MCLQYIKVKNRSSRNGIAYAYVPCGKCADCRRKEQAAWRFRLRTEFSSLKEKGWNIGFITLTYSPDCLPTIPEECFKNVEDYKEIACFDRDSVRKWIADIRQYCKYHYKMVKGNNIRYFICSEYGSNTHRPHYHAILAWNPECGCDYEKMHALCDHFWSKGLVGPQNYKGDRNCGPFEVVGDATSCLTYVCKYVSKDIDYVDKIKDISFYEVKDKYEEDTDEYWKAKKYANCGPFHLQSISLGYEPIRDLSDEDKMDMLRNGQMFVGDDQVYEVPMYIKNKLIYNNYYVIDENGKRLVRREANEFFEKNREEFFEKKSKFYDHYVNDFGRSLLEESGVDSEMVEKIVYAHSEYKKRVEENCIDFDLKEMGRLYLAYNHVDFDRCYDIPLVEQWMLRYRRPEYVEEDYEIAKEQGYEWKKVNGYQLSYLHDYWNFIDSSYFYVNAVKIADREAKERLDKKILDYWHNVVCCREVNNAI